MSRFSPTLLIGLAAACFVIGCRGRVPSSETRALQSEAKEAPTPEPPRNLYPLAPFSAAVLLEKPLGSWGFDRPGKPWRVLQQAECRVAGGVLRIETTGDDGAVLLPLGYIQGPLAVRWRMRTFGQGPAEWFFASPESLRTNPGESLRVPTINDGQWHSYRAVLPTTDLVVQLRFDPITSAGVTEIDDVTVSQLVPHPLQFEEVRPASKTVHATVRNVSKQMHAFRVNGKTGQAIGGQTVAMDLPAPSRKRFEEVKVRMESENLPSLERSVHVYHPEATGDSVTVADGDMRAEVERDGSGARLLWKGRVVAVLAPLVQAGGATVRLEPRAPTGNGIAFRGGPVERLELVADHGELTYRLEAKDSVTGPALRVLGELEQGLLAGVEYLGKGEASSSRLDIERSEHVRFEPDPLLLTMPLAALVTDRGSAALLWDDPDLQPVFSAPNRYDGTPDHLAALRGRSIHARIRLGAAFAAGSRLEDAILWAVSRRGLPEPPASPRSADEERALCVQALTGPVRKPAGWLHAAWSGSRPGFFSEHASALWRLTGEVPSTPELVSAGFPVENYPAFLVTGRAQDWLRLIGERAAAVRGEQWPDGSFRYRGKYRRGHRAGTASGYSARRAAILLEHACYTGDDRSRQAGIRALDSMKHFRTPRGAQTWEMPLHTPDLLACYWLVRACVRGYELTGQSNYLADARRWAVAGLPFVYQWGRFPIMKYTTVGVLGATDWTGVVWLGRPLPWCGLSYAWALTLLASHDRTVDWRKVASGILAAAEEMQYPDGPLAGCLPDSFDLPNQQRLPAPVDPCLLELVRLRLEGQIDNLAVARDGLHRIVAPFPVKLEANRAIVQGRRGTAYQVVVDGDRVIVVESTGTDVIELGSAATRTEGGRQH